MKGIIKDTFILFIITLVAGLMLGGVYHITKEPISKQERIAKDRANKAVFEDADAFVAYEGDESESYLDSQYSNTQKVDEILVAEKDDEAIGYVITITTNEGYGGNIKLVVGIDNSGTVKGISFLEIGETAGLGMNATKEKFYGQFAGKNVDKFVYTKNGKSADNEIDAISSATITTNAVTNAVNGALSVFSNISSKGGATNE